MPLDSTGREVRLGQRVTIEFAVADVWTSLETDNVKLDAIGTHAPGVNLPRLICDSRLLTIEADPAVADVGPVSG